MLQVVHRLHCLEASGDPHGFIRALGDDCNHRDSADYSCDTLRIRLS